MKIISFANQKGGVGKSTTCFNVGSYLAKMGKRVLLIDADPQCDLTTMSGHRAKQSEITLDDVLKGADVNAAVNYLEKGKKGSLALIPSDEYLYRAEIDLVSEKRTILKDAIDRLDDPFDYVFIDCPPALSVFTVDALTASNRVLIPVQAQYLPLKGVAGLKRTIDDIQKNLNPDLKVGGVILTFFNARRTLDQQVRESLEKVFGTKVFTTEISVNTTLGEAPSYGQSIFDYAPKSKGAVQYEELSKEILKIK